MDLGGELASVLLLHIMIQAAVPWEWGPKSSGKKAAARLPGEAGESTGDPGAAFPAILQETVKNLTFVMKNPLIP